MTILPQAEPPHVPPRCGRGLIVVGTDTGVGKTTVTAAILRQLRQSGVQVGGYKPVASGCVRDALGRPVWDDVETIWQALGGAYSRERICPQTFCEPLAPPVAARLEGRQVDSDLLRSGAAWWLAAVDVLIVEGAGGLLSPLAARETIADLARDLQLPLLIVGRTGLGTINHTLLTIEAARVRQLSIVGVVLNEPCHTPGDLSIETNAGELAARCDVPVLGIFRHVAGADLLTLPDFLRIDWLKLMQHSV